MVVSVSMEKRKAEMKPLTLLTHGVHVSSSRWSRSPLGKKRRRMCEKVTGGGWQSGCQEGKIDRARRFIFLERRCRNTCMTTHLSLYIYNLLSANSHNKWEVILFLILTITINLTFTLSLFPDAAKTYFFHHISSHAAPSLHLLVFQSCATKSLQILFQTTHYTA